LNAFFGVVLAVEDGYVFDFAVLFFFAVFAFAGDFDAVIHHATHHAGLAVNAQIVNYGYSAVGPVKRVRRTRLYAHFALQAYAGVLVDGYGAFGEVIFVFVLGGFKQFLALVFLGRLGLFRRLRWALRKHAEYVN
jgi:hypothetical protein